MLQEDAIEEETEEEDGTCNNLEICFFNETASDDDEVNGLEGASDGEAGRDGVAGREGVAGEEGGLGEGRDRAAAAARAGLAGCAAVARHQLMAEQAARRQQDPLLSLVGAAAGELRQDLLQSFNIATLQVGKIEIRVVKNTKSKVFL